jgi:hypothetical protein
MATTSGRLAFGAVNRPEISEETDEVSRVFVLISRPELTTVEPQQSNYRNQAKHILNFISGEMLA